MWIEIYSKLRILRFGFHSTPHLATNVRLDPSTCDLAYLAASGYMDLISTKDMQWLEKKESAHREWLEISVNGKLKIYSNYFSIQPMNNDVILGFPKLDERIDCLRELEVFMESQGETFHGIACFHVWCGTVGGRESFLLWFCKGNGGKCCNELQAFPSFFVHCDIM